MGSCELKYIFGDLAESLPFDPRGEGVELTADNLPVLPAKIETSNLYLTRSSHTYHPSFKIDSIGFNAHKETYRYLGLLILSAIFHPQHSEITIKLNHPETEVSNLVVEYYRSELGKLSGGYHKKPFAFKYYPELTSKHPFDKCINPRNLPCFALTNLEDFVNSEDDWKNRDTIRISGGGKTVCTDEGMILFAELLLNVGLPQNEQDEYALEGENGFRGVGINSAEAILLLPGHIFWVDEHWQ